MNKDAKGNRIYSPDEQDRRDEKMLERRAAHLASKLANKDDYPGASYDRAELGALLRLTKRLRNMAGRP